MRIQALLFAAALGLVTSSPAWATPQARERATERERAAEPPRLDVPFVPTDQKVVTTMLDMAGVTANDVVIDLGSGDGRIAIAAAKRGARASGVDINPERIRESTENARSAGVSDRAKFIKGNLFDADLRGATVVTMYLLPDVNLKIRPKLLRELKPGTRVVSHDFHLGEWQPDATAELGNATVYLWVVPANVEGTWRINMPVSGSAATQPAELTLKQSFQKIDGSIKVGERSLTIEDGKVVGDQVSFSVVQPGPGGPAVEHFRGRLSGAQLQGSMDSGSAQSASRANVGWVATRTGARTGESQ